MCLAVGVWAPGNEKVIGKIQGLGEGHMNELMKSIEEVSDAIRCAVVSVRCRADDWKVMDTMPPEEGAEEEKGASPIKRSPDLRDLRWVMLTHFIAAAMPFRVVSVSRLTMADRHHLRPK